MPVPPAPQPSSHVRLFVEGVRHDVIEFSPAGVTLPRTALEAQNVAALRRGEPCPATIQVFGEMYGVVLRLAARTPLHIEFAFVSLAPQARRALDHYANRPTPESVSQETSNTLPKPFALAFARLAEVAVPAGKRIVLAESKPVFAMTVERRSEPESAPAEEVAVAAPALPDSSTITITARDLLAYGTALLAVLSLVLMWTLG